MLLAEIAARKVDGNSYSQRELLIKAFSCGRLFQQPNGKWPKIGDVDSAQSIPVARANYWDFSPMHQLAAVALDREDISCSVQHNDQVSMLGDELYWLQGTEGIRRRLAFLPQEQSTKITTLAESGYFVARDSENQVIFDSGSIAHGLHPNATRSTAHGHADTLQILYTSQSQELLCDCGMPNYAGDQERAAYFRSPHAHNTVSLGGAEYVRPAGGLNWSHEVNRPSLYGAEHADRWQAQGRVEWTDCSIQRHLLVFPGQCLWVADWIESDCEQKVTWNWHFPMEMNYAVSTKNEVSTEDDVAIHISTTGEITDHKMVYGSESDFHGWASPAYGEMQPIWQLRFEARVRNQLLVLTSIGQISDEVGFRIGDLTLASNQNENFDSGFWMKQDCPQQGTWFVQSN